MTTSPFERLVTPTSVSFGVPIVSGPGQLDKAVIRRYFERDDEKLEYCYERQLLATPELSGSFTAQFAIDESGNVKEPSVTSNSLNDPDVETCVVVTIKAIRFPRPVGGKVSVRFPMTFSPEHLITGFETSATMLRTKRSTAMPPTNPPGKH